MRNVHVLNLGAGRQSTELYEMAAAGEIPPFDFAVVSDTQDEFGAVHRRRGLPDPIAGWDDSGDTSFYHHMDWMATRAAWVDSQSPLIASSKHGGPGCPILVRTRGQISADLLRGENSTGQRFATIPAYTLAFPGAKEGQTKRQCTKEYKVEVIEIAIRRDILGLAPGHRVPKDVTVHQYIGISWDERSRAVDIASKRFSVQQTEDLVQQGLFGEESDTIISVTTGVKLRASWQCHFPLIENGRRLVVSDCERSLRYVRQVPHKVSGSACVECPFKDDETWATHMKDVPTRGELIQIDYGIRTPGVIINRNLTEQLYLHRECRPIDQIDFERKNQLGFAMECEGGCGL